MALLRWPLLCLLAILTTRRGEAVQLKDELDVLLCPSVEIKTGKIIDVHKSLDLGAKLLDGSLAATLDQCVSECCHKTGCDLALYKNDGLSQSGKNCYYIECVAAENCVMVEHSGFTSVVFKSDNKDDDNHNGDDRTGHTPPTANSAPSTQSPPTTTTAVDSKDNDSTVGRATPSVSSPTANSNSSGKTSDDGGSTEAPPTEPAADLTEKIIVEIGVDDKSVLSQDGGGVRDECGRHGCDGSGLIAIAVVGSICFVIIVLVVAVLLRKVVSDSRRRRFNNVDYLINGMYT